MRQIVKVRTKQVQRMEYITKVIVFVAVMLFAYTCYKYFFYSADCQPLNYMSIEVNSLFNLVGLGTDFIFWMVPVLIFFWPTKRVIHEEHTYRKAKKRWSKYSNSSKINNDSDSDSNGSGSSSDTNSSGSQSRSNDSDMVKS